MSWRAAAMLAVGVGDALVAAVMLGAGEYREALHIGVLSGMSIIIALLIRDNDRLRGAP